MGDSFITDSYRGDIYDWVELQQLLRSPHRVIYAGTSPYQEILLIESRNIRYYWNHSLEMNTLDERIYYEALVHPAMLLSARHERILILGGEDGFALREVLKYEGVRDVSVICISQEILKAARSVPEMIELNDGSLQDSRVHLYDADWDAFFSSGANPFDVIIIDLPEPETEASSRLYTTEFFHQLSNILSDDGIMVCQSASLEQTPLVFWSIARTIEEIGLHTLSYHLNVPWFGDWGFHLVGKNEIHWENRKETAVLHRSLPKDMRPWFDFSPELLSFKDQGIVNSSDCLILHKFYAASEVEALPPKGRSVFYDLLQKEQPVKSNDTENSTEFRQLLSGPHRILYEGGQEGDHVLIIETNDIRLYLDKQLQFSSLDEQIYHEALVHPALAMVPKRNRILIVGGGDGFAIREILKYPDVSHIDLVDLDPLILHLAKHQPEIATLNADALHDKRVTIHQQDIQKFIATEKNAYDVMVVDLPDPGDEILSRLYSAEFFRELTQLINDDGILVCQSHSPDYAPLVYWSIGLTLKGSGLQTLSYHVDVPSFGDWGFHLAAKKPLLWGKKEIPVPTQTLPEDMSTLFDFEQKSRSVLKKAQMNTLEDLKLHEFYSQELHGT